MVANTLSLPKPYLSYSALSLWWKDKNAFRKQYYEGIRFPGNAYTYFGSEVAEILEASKTGKLTGYPEHIVKKLRNVPAYEYPEHRVKTRVRGIPLLGHIDSFSYRQKRLIEYKTGIPHKDGSPRWTPLEVQRHIQLPFYCLLIREKYGRYHPLPRLVWLETEWSEDTVEQAGGVILTRERKLQLTGKRREFVREVTDTELDRLADHIENAAFEIAKDYAAWSTA